jgi:formamidopyrimidine-DNA glycosylase
MPELPEVEQFRRLLLPLASSSQRSSSSSDGSASSASTSAPPLRPLTLELPGTSAPPRRWLDPGEAEAVSGRYGCADVLRKGKLLCLVLRRIDHNDEESKKSKSKSKINKKSGKDGAAESGAAPPSSTLYLYLHMGMTGRIASPGVACKFAEGPSDDGSVFPPPHTHLILRCGGRHPQHDHAVVAFADPRKFGSALLRRGTDEMDALAPDALEALRGDASPPSSYESIVSRIAGQSTPIKALLMDQKRAVSGVGNWVADEVLYQCRMHPDQAHLTLAEAEALCEKLLSILSTAVDCLADGRDFPPEWLFPYRWTKKKASKDHKGRSLTFIVRRRRRALVCRAFAAKVAVASAVAAAGGARGSDSAAARGPKSTALSLSPLLAPDRFFCTPHRPRAGGRRPLSPRRKSSRSGRSSRRGRGR